MANKQRGPLPPVLSPEETRVKPPEEDEAELPPEDPSWDPQRDATLLQPNTTPVTGEEQVEDATPAVPRKIVPVPLDELPEQALDDPTISLAAAAPKVTTDAGMHAPTDEEDATRHIPRKSTVRPPQQEEDDSTRQIPRKSTVRPPTQEPDDPTRQIPRKTGSRPALQDSPPPVRNPARKSGTMPPVMTRAAPAQEPLPWEAGQQEDDLSRLPTRGGPPPPPFQGNPQALVYPPEGPPVLVPVNTEPHFLAQAPKVSPVFTQPNYVPPPPSVVSPIVTAPHLNAPPPEAPPEGDLRTTFSNKAAMVADLVKATFARKTYGTPPFRLRIDEPDGPSTAGGLHARQPISLVAYVDTVPAIVVGWVDVARKESQLRTYEVVKRRHQHRYTVPLEITEREYERFLDELVETLFYGGIKIMLQVPDDEPPPGQSVQAQAPVQAQVQVQPQTTGRGCFGTLFILGVTFSTGIAVGMFSDFFALLSERLMALLAG